MSIIEIAQEAAVSISTVSRFFNKPETVSPKIAAKIQTVVNRVQYQPPIVRPGPKANDRIGLRSGMIALISLADFSPSQMWRMPALPILIGSIQETLIRRQLSLYLGQIDRNGKLPDCVCPRSCDGIILFSKPSSPERLAKFKKNLPDLPIVWCFREHADEERRFDHVFYDNSAVGALAADYLASRGHRIVAVFNPAPDQTVNSERLENFSNRAELLGLKVRRFQNQDHRLPFPARIELLTQRFLQERDGATGAFFCVDQDMLAIYTELLRAGFEIRKLDMVGCNRDEVVLQYLSPRPASIDIKIEQIGQLAVDQLLRRINSGNTGSPNEIFINPELIKGDQ